MSTVVVLMAASLMVVLIVKIFLMTRLLPVMKWLPAANGQRPDRKVLCRRSRIEPRRRFNFLGDIVTAGVLLLSPLSCLAQSHAPAPLFGTDALGRKMPEPDDVRPFRADRYVGAFYFLWLGFDRVYDNSVILRENPQAIQTSTSPPWGPPNAFHFWGQPMFGYYRSDDPWVLRRHAMLLSDAGVDFLVFDTTNAVIYKPVVEQLCKVFDQQRRLGEHVPQITFMVNSSAGSTAQRIYEWLYKPGRYRELWFRWKGKPLLICDPKEASEEVVEFFTLRKAHWPFELVNTQNAWHWEATYPQVYSYNKDPNQPEQVNVSVGQNLHQETGRVEMMSTGKARGRSFHRGKVDDRPHAYRYGLNFQEQWQRALELDPEVVFITGWNEWIAMQLNKEGGRPIFCDQFNLEFSRDVEMMNGGYGDNYYMQMAANIRKFKGMPKVSLSIEDAKTDDDATSRPRQNGVQIYRDHALETLPRDFPGCGDHHYKVDTGRNDFRVLKVTHDQEYVYFMAETDQPIAPQEDATGIWLLIATGARGNSHWEGFDFLVNRVSGEATKTSVETCQGGWQWQSVGQAFCRIQANEVRLAVPRELLGVAKGAFSIDFKWIDNMQNPCDILDLYTHGDTAPNGRFRYRYQSADSAN